MDFWDLFIQSEQLTNKAAVELLDRNIPEFHDNIKNYTMAIYDDFVDLHSISKKELIIAIALLNNIDKLNRELTPAAIVTLYKFYSMVFNSFEEAGENMFQILNCKSIRFNADKLLIDSFQKTVTTYSNFADTSYLDNLNFEVPIGKLFVLYNNLIIVVYLKEADYEK